RDSLCPAVSGLCSQGDGPMSCALMMEKLVSLGLRYLSSGGIACVLRCQAFFLMVMGLCPVPSGWRSLSLQ
ncbi:hypothetical protein NDU88_007354, partial [Pleurodeles waltl]